MMIFHEDVFSYTEIENVGIILASRCVTLSLWAELDWCNRVWLLVSRWGCCRLLVDRLFLYFIPGALFASSSGIDNDRLSALEIESSHVTVRSSHVTGRGIKEEDKRIDAPLMTFPLFPAEEARFPWEPLSPPRPRSAITRRGVT